MNKLRAIWHILLGDSVMYRVTASRKDHISFRGQSYRNWWRALFPPINDAAIIECDTWEARDEAWHAGVSGESGRQSSIE